MNNKKLSEELNKLFEDNSLVVTMTHDTEGELNIIENNGYNWYYNGQYSESAFKTKNDCIKDFKKDMKRQGFYNIKIGDM